MGGSWPVAGRVVGIIAGEDSDLDSVRAALDAAGIVPLVIAPTGGFLGGADGGIPVQRTYLTARSTEFDAILVAASGAPARDAAQGRDAKAGQPEASLDPRVELLLSEMFRHAKAIGGWGPPAGGQGRRPEVEEEEEEEESADASLLSLYWGPAGP